jgi:hypothetical protein
MVAGVGGNHPHHDTLRFISGHSRMVNMAHGMQIRANAGQSPGKPRTLIRRDNSKNLNGFKEQNSASEALDGGSIPLTRSNRLIAWVVPSADAGIQSRPERRALTNARE